MNDRILSKEDILCMQYAGMKSSRIMNPDHAPEEYTEYFATYIDKVESVISMQEEYGITTLTFQNAHSRAEVCTPCVLPANTTNDVLWFHIRNTPRSMRQ